MEKKFAKDHAHADVIESKFDNRGYKGFDEPTKSNTIAQQNRTMQCMWKRHNVILMKNMMKLCDV